MILRRLLPLVLLLGLIGCSPVPAPTSTPKTAKRVISLVPSATEMIDSIDATDLLVGVTLNDNYPPSVTELPKVGDQTIDMERLLSLKPDLVVIDSNFNQDRQTLEDLGVQVLELHCERLQDVSPSLQALGKALDRADAAKRVADGFEQALTEVAPLSAPKTVFVEIWGSPLMTVGNETLVNDLLSVLGAENSYQDQVGYFQVDPEDVLSRQPDVVILPTKPNSQTISQAALLLEKAERSPRVIEVDPDLFVRPGPRLIDGLRHLTEQFKNTD